MPTRWLNQTQPPTLVNATLLLYINAAFAVLSLARGWLDPIPFLGILGGFGIANEKKWGYWLSVVISCFALFVTLGLVAKSGLDFNLVIKLIFEIALVYLLLNPVSRGYQKTWFK